MQDARYCPECGERLKIYSTTQKGSVTVRLKTCPKCGKKARTVSEEIFTKNGGTNKNLAHEIDTD